MSSFYGNAGSSGSGGGTADVPVATALRLGKVRPDNETITIDPDGTIHSKGGESSYKEGYLKNGKLYKKANFTGEYQLKSGTLYLDLPTLTQYVCVEGTLVPLNDKIFIGTTEEWEALSEEEKAKYDVTITNIVDELNNKIDKVEGKDLSTNDFTDEEKSKLAGLTNYDDTTLANKVSNVENALSNKVDKDGDKILSTNDFTDAYKDKLDNLSNYDDTSLNERLTEVEDIIPSNASSSNKLATLDDIPEVSGGTTDYSELNNKPQIAGVELSGNKTLSELGIQSAEQGKGLSTEDYTTEDKAKLAGLSNYDDSTLASKVADIEGLIPSTASEENRLATIEDIPEISEVNAALDNKVDKEDGKGLSTEDYTTEEKSKLAGLSNYDDSALAGRVSDLEGVIPGSASAENKLATMADIPTGSTGGSGVGTSDYLALDNKPQIAGVTLSGNRTLADLGIQPAEEGKGLSTEDYTSEEKSKLAGLSNYDDTALDNRVSNVENTLSDKVDKDGNKGLSTNDFSNEDKAKLDGLSNYDDSTLVGLIDDLENDLSNKIDKDGDKVLSTNDFTNEDKDKLDNLSNYDDTALSERITDIENIIPNDVSAENKLVTMSDIGETSVITPQDIDRLWEMELEDGDKEGY